MFKPEVIGRTDKVTVTIRQKVGDGKTEKVIKVEGFPFGEVENAVRGGLARLCGLPQED